MEDILIRYHELYEDMAHSGKPEKMKAFGEAEKWAMAQMVEISPKTAQKWLDKLEASHWNNYLSKHEAEDIAAKLVNQNGTKGAHWTYDVFKNEVMALGGKMEEYPYYNCQALWVTANMLYSDHYKSAIQYVPQEKLPAYFYAQALEKLKDVDHKEFIRPYFDV